MVAFVVSLVLLIVGVGICLLVGRRRPPGAPLTWGEAFVGGSFVFALLLLAYGVVPHQWLAYADNDLLWRADKLMLGVSGDGVRLGADAATLGGTGRIIVNAQAVRDMIAAALYGLFLAGQVWLWAVWQKRGRKKVDLELASAFGRPVTRSA